MCLVRSHQQTATAKMTDPITTGTGTRMFAERLHFGIEIQASRSARDESCPMSRQDELSFLRAFYLKSAFAHPVAQVVKFRPADLSSARDFDF